MTELLVRIFIKDSDNINNQAVRTSYGVLTSIVGVVCNIILFLLKLGIGMVINSISVMADAFNNLSDAASSIISFFGVKLANRPADKEHPFGHGRYEYIAALVVAFLVLQVGMTFMKNSIQKIIKPELIQTSWILVGILCISVLIKVWLALFNRNLGNRIQSSVMKAASTDAFGDIAITIATICSIVIAKVWNLQIDGFMGVVVSIFVLIAGIKIVKETLEPLLGQAASPELYKEITEYVEGYDGILGSHDLIVHNYGPSHTMATIHAEVSKDAGMEDAHEIIDRIERDVLRNLGIFLVIHMDPIEVNNQQIIDLKRMVKEIVYNLDERASIHDFRLVSGESQINLIFDLVVPYEYNTKEENKLMESVIYEIKRVDSRFHCNITVENSYVAHE